MHNVSGIVAGETKHGYLARVRYCADVSLVIGSEQLDLSEMTKDHGVMAKILAAGEDLSEQGERQVQVSRVGLED